MRRDKNSLIGKAKVASARKAEFGINSSHPMESRAPLYLVMAWEKNHHSKHLHVILPLPAL